MLNARRFIYGPESPLEGVRSDSWRRFLAVVEVQPMGAVSDSGGLGAYDVRPRRLVELGYAAGLRTTRTNLNRQVHACEFILPWTRLRFLSDPIAQYTVLAKSMRLYYDALRRGDLKRPEGMSLSGALVILHVGGKGALKAWPDLFENTKALYEAAKDVF